jgi:hypothetical protein
MASLAATFATLLVSAAAPAANPCIGEAVEQYGECQDQCREDFQLAKDGCLNRDHECVEVCRAEREVCREATGLDAALAECNQSLRAAKRACRDNNPPDSPELDLCIDQAQVVAFQCRDTAREAARPALKACAKQFKLCGKACPPPDPPSEAVDPAACKREAKTAYKTCRATCREDFQFQKDVCLNRDHACVEQCRANRDACRQPVEDELAADLDACSATRQQQVQNCKDTFAEGSPEREQCIDNAQVAAFQCRDAAREEARPGFEGCRLGFRTCAQACPPAP